MVMITKLNRVKNTYDMSDGTLKTYYAIKLSTCIFCHDYVTDNDLGWESFVSLDLMVKIQRS